MCCPRVPPTAAARTALKALAAAGCDVRVIPPMGKVAGDWTISISELARARRDGDGAVRAKVWLLSWRHLCASAGLTGYMAGLIGMDELGEHCVE